MDDKDNWLLTWPALFLVTGASFFLFNLFLRLIDGEFSPLLTKISIAGGCIGMLLLIGSLIRARSTES